MQTRPISDPTLIELIRANMELEQKVDALRKDNLALRSKGDKLEQISQSSQSKSDSSNFELSRLRLKYDEAKLNITGLKRTIESLKESR